jgi:hypothetical protein
MEENIKTKHDLSNKIDRLKLQLDDSMFDMKIAQNEGDSEMINSLTAYGKELTHQIERLEDVRRTYN